MKYSNYQDSVECIVNQDPFRSNSMHGFNWDSEFVVVSYTTPIAYIKRDCSKAFVNVRKYSVTTSKQQGYVRQAIGRIQAMHPDIEIVEYRDYVEIAGRK